MKLALFVFLTFPAFSIAQTHGGKPFRDPSAVLTAGPVTFTCTEIDFDFKGGGPGKNILRFELKASAVNGNRQDVAVLHPARGFQPVSGEAQLQPLPAEIFENAGGMILAPGQPQYERLSYWADYQGAPIGGFYGPEIRLQFAIEQDFDSKLVFARYRSWHIVDHGQACKATPEKCEPRQSLLEDNTYLCEAEALAVSARN